MADEIAFPNGMAVTPDNSTLIIAESHGKQLTAFDITANGRLSRRRVWAALDGYPDGICIDAENAVWYGDVPNKCCVRVREGGEVLQIVELDRGCLYDRGRGQQDVVPDSDRVAWNGEHLRCCTSTNWTGADDKGARLARRVAVRSRDSNQALARAALVNCTVNFSLPGKHGGITKRIAARSPWC